MWVNPETRELFDEPGDGLERVHETQCPLTGRLEKAVPSGAELVDGLWQQVWRLEPLTAAEEAQVVEAERINARHADLQSNQRRADNIEARAYLASTDWYVIRQQETGQPAPEEVLASRAAARAKVVDVA